MLETLRSRYAAVPERVGPSSTGALFGAACALGFVAQFATVGAQAITLPPSRCPRRR